MNLQLPLAAAGFGSLAMLGWLAAASIPIVLHLLNRRQQRSLPWAAMQMLQQVLEKESKRIRIEQLLLLALRICILVVLAIALARPFLSDSTAGGTEEPSRPPKLWIIAIDCSYSMGYEEEGGSRFEIARSRAQELVDESREGDAFLLVAIGQPSTAVIGFPTFNRQIALRELSSLTLTDAGSDVGSALALIQDLIADVGEDPRIPKSLQLTFLSDLSTDSWRSVIDAGSGGLLTDIQELMLVDIEHIGEPDPTNIAIRAIQPASNRTVAGNRLQLDISLTSFGAPRSNVPVQLELNGSSVASASVDLSNGQEQIVSLDIVPDSLGWSVITASVPEDNLLADNSRSCVIEVRDEYRMLFVEGADGDSRFWKLALQSEASAIPSGLSSTVSSIELTALELERWDIIILNDLPVLTEKAFEKLVRFVNRGGALICNFGPSTNSNNWNRFLGANDSLLGFRFTAPSTQQDLGIDPLNYSNPIVAPFEGYPDAGLLTTPIFRYWEVELQDSELPTGDLRDSDLADSDTETSVALATTDGAPLIVQHRLGKGRVASFLSAPSAGVVSGQTSETTPQAVASRTTEEQGNAWNAMTTWPSFLPLAQQTVQLVLNPDDSRQNLLAGESLQGRLNRPSQGSQVIVQSPDGEEHKIATEDPDQAGDRVWAYSDTDHRGIYEAELPDGTEQLFAVNVNTLESSLTTINADDLPMNRALLKTTAENIPSESNENISDTLVKSILISLICLLFAESLLAFWMGRRLG